MDKFLLCLCWPGYEAHTISSNCSFSKKKKTKKTPCRSHSHRRFEKSPLSAETAVIVRTGIRGSRIVIGAAVPGVVGIIIIPAVKIDVAAQGGIAEQTIIPTVSVVERCPKKPTAFHVEWVAITRTRKRGRIVWIKAGSAPARVDSVVVSTSIRTPRNSVAVLASLHVRFESFRPGFMIFS